MSAQVSNPTKEGRTLTKEPHRTPTMEESTTSRLRRMEDELDTIHALVLHIYRMLYAKEQGREVPDPL